MQDSVHQKLNTVSHYKHYIFTESQNQLDSKRPLRSSWPQIFSSSQNSNNNKNKQTKFLQKEFCLVTYLHLSVLHVTFITSAILKQIQIEQHETVESIYNSQKLKSQ